jgi:hypothetical protein
MNLENLKRLKTKVLRTGNVNRKIIEKVNNIRSEAKNVAKRSAEILKTAEDLLKANKKSK